MSSSVPIIYTNENDLPVADKVIDVFESGLVELFYLENPNQKNNIESNTRLPAYQENSKISPIWIYYSDKKIIIKSLPEDSLFRLRTARNKNLITEYEQKKFREFKIAVAGLSVGFSAIRAIVMSGGSKCIKLADYDEIEFTNLNRLSASLSQVGLKKIDVVTDWIWELDPFAQLELYPDGLLEDNLENFLLKPFETQVMVDAIDDIGMKIKIREKCRILGIPVIMATDNGDQVILDLERYDSDSSLELFHGALDETDIENFNSKDYQQWLSLANKIIDPSNLSDRLNESIREIGKTIIAIPQLGATAQIAGSIITFVIRQLAIGNDIPSGRYIFDQESIFK